jgi:hypothetical protein
VAPGKETDREPFDRLPLADDDLPEFLLQAAIGLAETIEFLNVVVVEIRYGRGAIDHGSHPNSWSLVPGLFLYWLL